MVLFAKFSGATLAFADTGRELGGGNRHSLVGVFEPSAAFNPRLCFDCHRFFGRVRVAGLDLAALLWTPALCESVILENTIFRPNALSLGVFLLLTLYRRELATARTFIR